MIICTPSTHQDVVARVLDLLAQVEAVAPVLLAILYRRYEKQPS
jgi:hypothetical protein